MRGWVESEGMAHPTGSSGAEAVGGNSIRMAPLIEPEAMSAILTYLALALAGVLLLVKAYLDRPPPPPGLKQLKPLSSLPSPKGCNLLLGHAASLLTPSAHLQFARWANELGPMYVVRLAEKNCIVLSDPQLALPLLSSGPDALPKAVGEAPACRPMHQWCAAPSRRTEADPSLGLGV
jgi:hypothetical protein